MACCDVGTPPDECKHIAGVLVLLLLLVLVRGSRGPSELVVRGTSEKDELRRRDFFIEGDKDGVFPSDDRSSTLIEEVGIDEEDEEAGDDEEGEGDEDEEGEEEEEGEEVYVTREIRGSWTGFAITARSNSTGASLVGE